MRTGREIEDRIRFLLSEEFEQRCKEASKRLPYMCTHNHRQSLDSRKRVEDEINETYNRITNGYKLPVVQTIGLCMLGSESPDTWQGTLCEDPIDAQSCPYFDPRISKEQVRSLFLEQISDPDWLRANMPEVYGLMWSLDTTRTLDLPWWSKVWYYFLRVKIEPLRAVEDPARLLPPA